jgi:FAD/FMN-containing dehydrogenase/Fe-S oxidoreductase
MLDQQRRMLADHLRKHTQAEVRFDSASRKLYSTDASIYQIEPLGVVLPRSVQDLVALVQVAAEMRLSLTPRGGGTSLSGQSIGPGVVVDCSKYLNRILEIDPATRTALVEPGVVLDQLNREVGKHDLLFGPEVSTSSRANLGGMIGNNSAGSRSIVYGKTSDHVRRLRVVLIDGSEHDLTPLSSTAWDEAAAREGKLAGIYRKVGEIVRENAGEIRQRFPRLLRRVSGYNLDVLADLLVPGGVAPVGVGLHRLLIGSEGTLGFTTQAELNLLPRPKYRGLLIPQFATLADAMAALAACLEYAPSAVEIMDHLLLKLARDSRTYRDAVGFLQGDPEAIFMVEFSSDERGDVMDRIDKLKVRLQGAVGVVAMTTAIEAAERDPLWNLRRSSMPLLYSLPGKRKPITFVEDPAVSPEKLPEFVARFRALLRKHGTDGAFYGHASVGCLHIRPLINLKDQTEVATMRRITEEVCDLVLEYKGSLSGEHGDGLVRSEWNKKMFGDVIYNAFRAVKAAFDPDRLLNPGKIVDAAPMTENLRYFPGYAPIELPVVFDYSAQDGFAGAVEMCNGNGVCRKTQGGAMCPSFRATRDEADSTRGRANILRHALASDNPMRDLRGREVEGVFDLCLQCKTCKTECPTKVDIAKIKSEFLQMHYAGRPRPLGHWFMLAMPWLNWLGSPVAPLVNWVQDRSLFRWLLEKTAGIDRRRSLPHLHRQHFRRWFRSHKPHADTGKKGRVLLLDDCFTTYHEPSIGTAAVTLLERAGYRVELMGICCGRIHISKGFLYKARSMVHAQAEKIARRSADGTPILGMEPSCLLTLNDEWPELYPSPETQAIAGRARLADAWLAEQVAAGQVSLPLTPRSEVCVLHAHCHQKALTGPAGSAAALRLVPALDVRVLDTTCCGMAGSFGYESQHYDLSVQIAELSVLPALRAAPEAVVAATGTSCRHQIKDLASRRALHPLEVLAGQLG